MSSPAPKSAEAADASIRHWGVLGLLVFSVFLNYIDRSNLSTAAPLLKGELGISASQLGILLSAFFYTYFLMQPIAGWLADRFHAGSLLAIGFAVWSVATMVTGALHGFAMLLAIRLVLGVGESVAYPSYSKIFATHFPQETRGLANALITTGLALGPAIGTFAGGVLMARYGWRPFFVVLGMGSLLWLIPWLKWMPPKFPAKVSADTRVEAEPPKTDADPTILDILRHPSGWGTCIGQFCGNYFWYFLLTWLPFYLVRERSYSMDGMAKVGGIAYLLIAIFAGITGWVSDAWLRSGASPTVVRKSVVVVGHAISAVALGLCVVAPPKLSVALLMLVSLGFGIYGSGQWIFPQTLGGPRAAGRWTGLQNFFGNMAGAVVPAVTGYIVQRTGHFFWAFEITAAVGVIGAFSWQFLVGRVEEVDWEQELKGSRISPLDPGGEPA